MTVEDIKTTVKDFQNAAINAVKAGFDGVEIHSSNGYLFQQFFNGTANHRTDEYGGSIENKARIFFEVLDAIKEVIPEKKLELVLIHHYMVHLERLWMKNNPTFEYIIKKLNDYNLAYIHLSEPFTDVSAIPYAVSEINISVLV
jgi:N-ethylmaleimide reductase